MSDGIVRVCNAHGAELRQLGAMLVCPHGHDCPVDWSVKGSGLPYADPRTRTCPHHGVRLTGAGDILDCQYGHQCSTRASGRPQPITPRETPRPEPGERHPMAPRPKPAPQQESKETTTMAKKQKRARGIQPHGTPQRYFQEMRAGTGACDLCRKAASAYRRERLEAKLKAAGKPLPKARPRKATSRPAARRIGGRSAGPARSTSLTTTSSRDSLAGPAFRGLVEQILSLREQLAAAENAFAQEANQVLGGWKIVPVVDVIPEKVSRRA